MTQKRWPATLAEFRELEAKAVAKYKPLVDALSPAELVGLTTVVGSALEALRGVRAPTSYDEDVRRARNTAGTRIGK